MHLAELLADPGSAAPAVISTAPPAVVTYRSLAEQIERLAARFAGAGLQPGDSVAVALPNGLALLAIVLACTRARLVAALLNPASTSDELHPLVAAAGARILVADDANAAAKDASTALGVPVWVPTVDANGVVGPATAQAGSAAVLDAPKDDDVALYAFTSGTTSRPKCVPLTHANVAWSARNIASTYKLGPGDRSLVVLPLFHGHGLIGATLSTLSSGGAVVLPERFSASAFWPLVREHGVTWYTAVPTIHQILVERADADGAPDRGLRFARSCSAPLPPGLHAQLEQRFGAPLLEAYGMTEAAHQVCSNPLPPRPNKPGTVGTGSGVSIVDEDGRFVGPGASGEVVVRGPNVMRGYRNDPPANAASFIDGWFRSGDVGVLDADGYLALTGRIADRINRGGEKISPEEVEAVLLGHPAVAKAVVFGVPDPKYGQEVQAAVVLRAPASAGELQAFCRAHVSDFKVPKVIHVVPALPVNALGKIVRRNLPAMFGAGGASHANS